MPMNYPNIWIENDQVPRAELPILQHLLDTYASETNKVISVWREFSTDAMAFKPHPRSSTVQEIMKHQLLSERRFFGEFLGTPEPPASQIFPEQELRELCQPNAGIGVAAFRFLGRSKRIVVVGEDSLF